MCKGIFLKKIKYKSKGKTCFIHNEDVIIIVQSTNSTKTITTENIKIGLLSTSLSNITKAWNLDK